MNRIPTSRTHIYKCLFNEILTNELFACGYKIDASFESKRRDRIGFAKITSDRTIRLLINTNFAPDPIFEGAETSRELGVIYRAYYIASYIRLLESVRERTPRSYFDSLVTLESICDTLEGKVTLYSPISQKGIRNFRPIDAYCAIRALTGIQLRHEDMLAGDIPERCEAAISELISYSALPEICFESSREPAYALISHIARLRRLTGAREDVLLQYKFFTCCGAEKLSQMPLEEISHLGDASACDFWAQAAIRLCAVTSRCGLHADDTVTKAVGRFREDSVTFMKDCADSKSEILRSDLTAVKKLSKKIGEMFPDNAHVCGSIHYYE